MSAAVRSGCSQQQQQQQFYNHYSPLHLYARWLHAHSVYLHKALNPVRVYVTSVANSLKHQQYIHDSSISMHLFGPTATTYIDYKRLVCHRHVRRLHTSSLADTMQVRAAVARWSVSHLGS